jgi:AbrB family looped-hinge helix DNA binding protein
MIATISSKGQIVIPSSIRRSFGLQTGDQMVAEVRDEQIILRPKRKAASKLRIVTNRKTGLPRVVAASASRVTSKMVHDALAEFP